MDFPSYYSDAEQKFVSSKLEPDEELIWTAKPKSRLWGSFLGRHPWLAGLSFCVVTLLASYAVVSVMFCRLSMYWLVAWFALYFPLYMRMSDIHAMYVLTNRRAMILHLINKSYQREWRGASLHVIEVNLHLENEAFGDVILERAEAGVKGCSWRKELGFFGVFNPLAVAQLVETCVGQGTAGANGETESSNEGMAGL